MHGLTILLYIYATSFASAEHPNIVLCKIFKILVALEAVNLQWSDHVNLELMYTPKYQIKDFHEITPPLMV